MKALHATRTASWPAVAVVGVVSHAVRIVPHSITSSAGTSDNLIRIAHPLEHGLRLPCLQQPPLANMRGDCRGDGEQEAEKGEPHQCGGVAPSRWRSQTIHHTTATTETPAPI